MGIAFEFELNQEVRIRLTGRRGEVYGLYVDRSGRQRFMVAYAAEGRQREDWFDPQDLIAVSAVESRGIPAEEIE